MEVGPQKEFAFRLFLLGALFLLAQSPLRAQGRQIAKTVRELHAIPSAEPVSAEVPPPVRSLLKRLKSELRELITAVLNKQPTATPEVLRESLMAEMRAAGLDPEASGEASGDSTQADEDYGDLEEVTVRRPPPHRNLLAVVITLQVPCGNDASLYLFELRGASWKLVLADEANGYDTVAGAQGNFQYAVSPPDADGSWFVVAGNVGPWCSSNWRDFRYHVLRPGDSPDHPQTLRAEQRDIYLGTGESFKLSVSRKGFQISQFGSQSLDPGILMRVHIQKYTVSGNRVSRVSPLALLPQDFLDEWVELPWEEASRWAASADPSALQEWQSRLQHNHSGGAKFTTVLDFVQPCPTTGNIPTWQIGLLIKARGHAELPADFPEELFLTVAQRAGDFSVAAVGAERPTGCPGESKPVETGESRELPE